MKKLIIFSVLLTIIAIWSCSSDNSQEVKSIEKIVVNNDKDLGLIEADVKDDAKDLLGAMPTYSQAAPGTSEKMERAFENAPPMIPHSTEGLLPIKINNNMCKTCHMPELAVAMKATPIPISHMTNYRPEVKLNTGEINIEASKKVTQEDLGGKLSAARFNCSQCHVPQAKIDVAIQNTFEAVYRNKDLKNKSNLEDNIKEGVK